MINQILSALAEQRKEHGYSILAAPQDVRENFTVSLRRRKEHGYSILASAILDIAALL